MRWTPTTLAAAAGGRLVRAGEREIAAAFIDSRAPRVDALFVPIVAARDGHDFIAAAARGGASASLIGAGRPVPAGAEALTLVEVDDTLAALTALARDARDHIEGPVVAITGSNGKTTTRAFVEAALASALPRVLCTRGNFNNHLGVPLTLVDAPHEPEAAVLELGMSAPGENDHLAGIVRPSVHVITSIALEHLEFMATLDAIAAAEAEPIAHLRPGPGGEAPALVIPADEPALRPHLPEPSAGVRVLRVGPASASELDGPLDVAITQVEVGVRTRARLRLRAGDQLELQLATFGAHNARNAASAVAVAVHLGLPLAPLVDALEAVEPVGDRGRLHELGPHLLIADCYNANPGSMRAALDSLAGLRGQRAGPLLAVLGDMLELGPTEAQLHREVGEHAAALGLDAILGFGPLTRELVEAAREGGVAATQQLAGDDAEVEDALAWVRAQLEAGGGEGGGAVLFKGSRGMRLERVVAGLLRSGLA
ncbi:UDP-N-acetylmuramoyl-tripeptide--D-alanyl-D-alanine ligase [Enhygromyxa salina]|uniref:UDP-N-acetylmuramoyl-tripeptide--D-alanyl-D-alanine ligase n=1 Tax=Enhygromyxa salina TaxID=215803 RepID=A0A2S9XI24_9BACT|nr:UDP-N-acetylmuramoyl-tripeptide--D-alanyl-D-alanine ligase [Enhygromyxa salina]PRP92529.1 UDP-N-acetylmuramoyl-tripeptide--D-alanyl-D-alanine ligase [Enhygromyxa salina]